MQSYSVYINGNFISHHKLLADAKKKAVAECNKLKFPKESKIFILSGPNFPFKKYDYDVRVKKWTPHIRKDPAKEKW